MLRYKTRRMCYIALMAAIYLVLSMNFSIKISNIHITFGSLPTIVGALCLGPLDAVCIAALGEFTKQLLRYGLSYTTILYMLPPMLRAFTVGVGAYIAKKRGYNIEDKSILYLCICILAAALTTLANTMVNLVDSIIFGYYSPVLIYGDLLYRLFVGMITAVIVALVAKPLTAAIKRSKILWT